MRTEQCFALDQYNDKKPCKVLYVGYKEIHKENYCDKCRFYKTKEEFERGYNETVKKQVLACKNGEHKRGERKTKEEKKGKKINGV